MDYFSVSSLRDTHAGWSLLRAQNAPLALTFFMSAFTDPNERNATAARLERASAKLTLLHERIGSNKAA